ncbi:hypothetical protein D3C71_314780 [compost metagenome]
MGTAIMPMDRIATVTDVLTDLGVIVRRSQAETLDRDTFHALAQKMRRQLKALRIELTKDEMPFEIELTDLGASIGQMLDNGVLTKGTALLEAVPDRCRTYGRFVVVDGDRPFDTPYQQGA